MNENVDILELIKSQVNKAKTLFNEKDSVDNLIKEIFDKIKEAMEYKIEFIFEKENDRYGDEVITVYATNQNIFNKHTVLTYDFDNKQIFPVKINGVDDIPWLCNDQNAVKGALAKMIADDNFMIRLVAISKEEAKRNFDIDDDIPF